MDNKHKNKNEIEEADPTSRQEFPGAKTNKEKIKAGKRNIKNMGTTGDKKVSIEEDVPKSDSEPPPA